MAITEYMVLPGQITKIHVLLGEIGKQLGLTPDEAKLYKQARVREYTDKREASTTKLTWKEAQDLITGLEAAAGRPAAPAPAAVAGKAKQDEKDQADRKRKRIISMGHSMGWQVKSEGRGAGSGKIDMQRVNAWCVKSGHLHVPLNDYSNEELSKLVWQMEAVYKHYLETVSR